MASMSGFDRAALFAVVATAAEEFEADVLLLVRDGSEVRMGASEGAGLDAKVILSQCLRRLDDLEEQSSDPTMQAFVRIACEDLDNEQVLLVVRDRGEVRLAAAPGARGKVRGMLDDALQGLGGERRRR
jgi:hypothetical protein